MKASITSSVVLTTWAWGRLGCQTYQAPRASFLGPPGALPHSTMMGKLPLGVVSPYVKMSSGGCKNELVLRFFIEGLRTVRSRGCRTVFQAEMTSAMIGHSQEN